MDIDKKSLSKYGIEITDYNITASDNEGYGSNFDIEMCLQCGLIEGQSKLADSITLVSVFYNKDGELVTSQELFHGGVARCVVVQVSGLEIVGLCT